MLGLLSHRGFLLVSLISLMNAVLRTGGLFALIPLLATTTLGLSVAEIGFAMMVSGVCGLVAAYPAGWLADHLGRKPVIVPSTLLTGMSMVMFCFAPSYAGSLCRRYGTSRNECCGDEHIPNDGGCGLYPGATGIGPAC
jgi:MFS family permease